MVALNDSLTKNPESVRKNLWQSRRYVEVYNRQASMITEQKFGCPVFRSLLVGPCALRRWREFVWVYLATGGNVPGPQRPVTTQDNRTKGGSWWKMFLT